MKPTLFSILFLLPFCLLAQQRGMKPVTINVEGKPVSLYTGSHALVIGVADYWNVDKLPGVIQDIDAVKRALETQDFSVTTVKNPTKEQLVKAFADFIAKYGQAKDNRLLVYFAGHGHTISTNYNESLGYLLPVDAPKPTRDNQAVFQESSMEMAQLEIYAKRIQAKHALFVFDACFSGSLFENTRAIPNYISYNTSKPVRQFITSGTAEETVPDQSIFCRQFVEGISGEADTDKDGYVTGTELGAFIQKMVLNYSRNAQHPQYGKIRNPNLDKGDFVFVMSPKNIVKPAATEIVGNKAVMDPDTTARIIVKKKPAGNMPWLPEMVLVPSGTFQMGSNDGADDETPLHRVTLNEFYIGKTEVTRKQWKEVMGYDQPGNNFNESDQCPVEKVSWSDIQDFLAKLNKKTDKTYRLPTEAEWEYAAGGGNKSKGYTYSGSDNINDVAWYRDNSDSKGHPVGLKKANELGLFDMSGNVWEWCSDWYDQGYYQGSPVSNPQGPSLGSGRVVRGGSWVNDPRTCRITGRIDGAPDDRGSGLGFRLVLVP